MLAPLARSTLSQCLSRLSQTHSLVSFACNLNPLHPTHPHLTQLAVSLSNHHRQAAALLLAHRVPPPLPACPVLMQTLHSVNQLLGLSAGSEELAVVMERHEDWVNDKLRDLNEAELREPELRALLVGFRGCLELGREGLGARKDGVYGRALRLLL